VKCLFAAALILPVGNDRVKKVKYRAFFTRRPSRPAEGYPRHCEYGLASPSPHGPGREPATPRKWPGAREKLFRRDRAAYWPGSDRDTVGSRAVPSEDAPAARCASSERFGNGN